MSLRGRLVAICGPTASGKSRLALELARSTGAEIVNFDSLQIYRRFDIGSAKPSREEMRLVPHHLIDIADPGDSFTVADYSRAADEVCASLQSRSVMPLLTGGTGFYLRSVLSELPQLPGRSREIRERIGRIRAKPRGPQRLHALLRKLDPVAAQRIAVNDSHRVERAIEVAMLTGMPITRFRPPSGSSPRRYDALLLALAVPREELVSRIDERTEQMYRRGLVDEAAAIARDHGEVAPLQSIGYREALAASRGALTIGDAIRETKRRTRAYAKRQMTWIRGEMGVHWLEAGESNAPLLLQRAREIIESWRDGRIPA